MASDNESILKAVTSLNETLGETLAGRERGGGLQRGRGGGGGRRGRRT